MSFKRVSISPLVLLSVVDHYKRLSSPRVVGILLGTVKNNSVIVSNSFAVPFEESEDNFFIDTSYLQNIFDLYYKVNCKENIVGWYHSSPKLMPNDLEITKAITKYCESPILAVINVHLTTSDIPCQIYELGFGDKLNHVNVQVGADDTEEVGVEHLLRDIKEGTGSSMKDKINQIKESLHMYRSSLDGIIGYLEEAEKGRKVNQKILNVFQQIMNSVPKLEDGIVKDNIYAAEMVNAVIAMNDLEKNKAANY